MRDDMILVYKILSGDDPNNLVFVFIAAQGFFLCNVGKIFAATGYYQRINLFKIKIAKNIIQTTLHWIFSCAMLSGASWETLHRVFVCAVLSQKYYDFIEQDFFMCSVVWNLLDNTALGIYLCKVAPRELRKHWTGFFFLCNVVWSLKDNIA